MVFVGKLLQMVFVMKIINSIADIDGNRINCVYDIIDELFCPVYGMKDRIKNYTKVFNHAIATAGIDFDIMMNKETADKENVRSAYLYLKYFFNGLEMLMNVKLLL